MKILYLAGTGRSGSTILGRVLAESPGFFMAGEISRLWNRIVLGRHVCGCSKHLPDCPFWSEVFDEAFGGFPGVDPGEMKARLDRSARNRHLMMRILPGRIGAGDRSHQAPAEELRRLYRAIARVSGCRVIIDISKGPSYARLLAETVGMEVHVLHLVRDPRGVAFSWSRTKAHPITGEFLPKMTWAKSTLDWVGLNLLSEGMDIGLGRFLPYLRVRYEDFAAHPWAVVRRIHGWLGEGVMGGAAGERSVIALGPGHAVSGNPNRYDVGPIELRADEEWRQRMGPGRKLMIIALAWPLMVRYGYSLHG